MNFNERKEILENFVTVTVPNLSKKGGLGL